MNKIISKKTDKLLGFIILSFDCQEPELEPEVESGTGYPVHLLFWSSFVKHVAMSSLHLVPEFLNFKHLLIAYLFN